MGRVIGAFSSLLSTLRRRFAAWRMERMRKQALRTTLRRRGNHLLDDAGIERADRQAEGSERRDRPWML